MITNIPALSTPACKRARADLKKYPVTVLHSHFNLMTYHVEIKYISLSAADLALSRCWRRRKAMGWSIFLGTCSEGNHFVPILHT